MLGNPGHATVRHSNAMCLLKPPLWPVIEIIGRHLGKRYWEQEYMHRQVVARYQKGNVPKQHGIVVGKRHLTLHSTHPTLGNEEVINTSTNTLTGLRTFTQTSQDECGNLYSLLTPFSSLSPTVQQDNWSWPSSPPVPKK